MKKLESMLKHQLNDNKVVPYPNFESMWERLEQKEETTVSVNAHSETGGQIRSKNWSKIAIVASLSALLAAAPVYAAVQYNWDNILRSRGGVQSVLAQNLGQQLDQSVTQEGVTLKLHTAIVDENRTVILFSLKVEKPPLSEIWRINGMSLKGAKGDKSGGEFNYLQWDEKNQRYNGYFESDWKPQQDTVNVKLTIDNLQAFTSQEMDLALDINSAEKQSFQIGQEGMRSIEVQPFSQNGDKLLFSSAIIFDQPEAKGWTYPSIYVYNDGTLVNELAGATIGTPGDHGEYTAKQYFKQGDLSKAGTTYKLQYMKKEKSIAGPLVFDLQLSKKQMESGTIKTTLNLPLESGETDFELEKMIVTPTQIRLDVRGKERYANVPYKKYTLEVAGKTLEGSMWISSKDDPHLTTLRFERPSDLVITEETPISFVGKYKVTTHEAIDDKTPFLLTNISEKKQTLIEQLNGYSVKWTYYKQGEDLYVETESEDAHFGGINQTHIGLGKERILGRPVTDNFDGDGNNKAIDVYKDFKGTEASIYIFYYSTDDPEKETRIELQP